MDFDAIRKVACWKNPSKKPEPPKPAAPPPPPPPPAAPSSPPPGLPQGSSGPPHTGHYMEMFENFPGDPRFAYLEHSRSWKLGLNPNCNENCSWQDYQRHIPGPQEYYRSYYGNPGMNSRGNCNQIGYYPDDSMGTFYYLDDNNCNYQSHPGYQATSRRPRGTRLALPPPDIHMDGHNHGYHDHDHHHGYGQSSRGYYYGGNRRPPPIREFGPGACGPPAFLGPPSPDYPYHYPGAAQYYLPSTHGNYFSDENPNGCSIM